MAHENLKEKLVGTPGKFFVMNLTHRVYDWSVKISDDYINYRMFEEVTIREYTGRKNRWGEDDPDHYRFDCVFFVEPGWKALNQRQVYTVGVELKNSKADLMADDKMNHYIGYTNFFFLGVPSELVNDAVNRAYENPDGQIGVFSVDDGKIQLFPQKISPSVEHERDLLQQIMYSRMFDEDLKGRVSFKIDEVEIIQPTFKENIESGPVQNQELTNISTGDGETYNKPSGETNTAQMPNTSTASVKVATDVNSDSRPEISEDEKTYIRLKEMQRQRKHEDKVFALQREVNAMNEEVSPVIVSILNGLSLGDQRVYHAIRRHGGIQAQNIAEVLPYQEGIEQPSIATIKRSISALTKAGLIEREGSKKTGQYVVKAVDCDSDSCQVCAKSPLCKQFQEVD